MKSAMARLAAGMGLKNATRQGVLLKAIEAVEAVPESRVLGPRKKAQVIGALYSMWADGEIPSAEKGLDTAARLVALAS